LAIIVAKPWSVNNIENALSQIIGSNLYIPKIATLISSEYKMDNIAAIKLFNEHIHCLGAVHSLENYDNNIMDKLVVVLNENCKIDECQRATKDIMHLEDGRMPKFICCNDIYFK